MKPFVNLFLSKYMTASRENYSISHNLIRLIKSWKKSLSSFMVRRILMDLSKLFKYTSNLSEKQSPSIIHVIIHIYL